MTKLVCHDGCAILHAQPLALLAAGRCMRRAVIVGLVAVVAGSALGLAAHADPGGPTSSRAARDEAVRAIPWRQMSPDDRRSAQTVIKDTSIYRRLPTRVIDCDPDLFNFLFQHPEVVIDVWRVMGISQVKLDKLPNGTYRGTDGAGTNGVVKFLHANFGQNAQNLAVIYADGAYEGQPFVVPLKAQSIMLLRSSAVQETNGRHYVTVQVDSFVRIEQMGIELVAKTAQPWISKTADRNFIETLSFVSNFSRTAEKNPQGMQRLATRLNAIDEPTRNELVALCFRTAGRYAQRETADRTSADLLAHHGQVVVDGDR